jgi:hypothetical protein
MEQMKQLTFIPAIELEQHEKISPEKSFSIKAIEKDSADYNFTSGLSEKNQDQESQPIGIETGMAYIAIPVSLAVWVGIAYLVKLMFF